MFAYDVTAPADGDVYVTMDYIGSRMYAPGCKTPLEDINYNLFVYDMDEDLTHRVNEITPQRATSKISGYGH